MIDGYRLPPIMFNEGEAASLLTAEKFIGRMTDKETQAYYSSAMMKIKAILRSSEKQSLEILDDSIAISDHKNWENKTYLQDLFKSISSKSVLEVQYIKADGSSSRRKLEPIGCFHQFNKWYLLAFCQVKKDYRTFKINRIESLQVMEEHFDTEHITLQTYIDNQNDSWKEQHQFYTIEIAFTESHVKFAESRKYYFGFVGQKVIENKIHMKFQYSSLEIIARWLLQFADQATVIAPVELKDRLNTLANDLYKHYN